MMTDDEFQDDMDWLRRSATLVLTAAPRLLSEQQILAWLALLQHPVGRTPPA